MHASESAATADDADSLVFARVAPREPVVPRATAQLSPVNQGIADGLSRVAYYRCLFPGWIIHLAGPRSLEIGAVAHETASNAMFFPGAVQRTRGSHHQFVMSEYQISIVAKLASNARQSFGVMNEAFGCHVGRARRWHWIRVAPVGWACGRGGAITVTLRSARS